MIFYRFFRELPHLLNVSDRLQPTNSSHFVKTFMFPLMQQLCQSIVIVLSVRWITYSAWYSHIRVSSLREWHFPYGKINLFFSYPWLIMTQTRHTEKHRGTDGERNEWAKDWKRERGNKSRAIFGLSGCFLHTHAHASQACCCSEQWVL